MLAISGLLAGPWADVPPARATEVDVPPSVTGHAHVGASAATVMVTTDGVAPADDVQERSAPLVEALDEVTGRPGDVAARVALMDVLASGEHDPAVLSVAVRTAGASRVARALTALGSDLLAGERSRNHAVAAAADALRAGVARASSTWSSAEATVFAHDLVEAARTGGVPVDVIGFLFADPGTAPIGVALTVATADAIEGLEEAQQGPWRAGPGGPGQGLADADADADADAGGQGAVVHDPAARVLGTLAQHPEAARDWLTSGHDTWGSPSVRFDTSRIDHWFGARDWAAGGSDGFAGIGALWAGVQTTATDGAEVRQVAAINRQIWRSLVHHPAFDPDVISSAGSELLALAVSRQMGSLVATRFGVIVPPEADGRLWDTTPHSAVPVPVVTASAVREWVNPVLAVVLSRESGRQVMQTAAMDHERSARAAVLDGRARADVAVEGVVVAWSAVDGATAAAAGFAPLVRDERAVARDETKHRGVDVVTAFSPAAPLMAPALHLLLRRLEDVAEPDRTSDDPDPRTLTVYGDEISMWELVEDSVAEYQRLGVWVDPDELRTRDFIRDVVGSYETLLFLTPSRVHERWAADRADR